MTNFAEEKINRNITLVKRILIFYHRVKKYELSGYETNYETKGGGKWDSFAIELITSCEKLFFKFFYRDYARIRPRLHGTGSIWLRIKTSPDQLYLHGTGSNVIDLAFPFTL